MTFEKEKEKIEKENQRIETIKQLQADNIEKALAADKKLEILKNKANELEERLRLFSKNTYDLKAQVTHRNHRKRKFVLIGMLVFTIASIFLKSSPLGSMMNGGFHFVLSLLIGGGIGYGIYALIQYGHKKMWHSSVSSPVKNRIPSLLSPSVKRGFHPLFDALASPRVSTMAVKKTYDQSGLKKTSRYKLS